MNDLTVIDYHGKRVLTTNQLALVYETDSKNIQMNYSNNQGRFELGRDVIFLTGDDLREFKNSLPNEIGKPLKFAPTLYLWTERGANRHSKLLGTDKAWEQFDRLEETYFRVKTGLLPQMSQAQILAAIAQQAADQEQKLIAITARTDAMEQRLDTVKDTMLMVVYDNWREHMRGEVVMIANKSKLSYGEIYSESYRLLELRAGCSLSRRIKKSQDRLKCNGASLTAIAGVNAICVIEEDKRLKEIYTSIIKELKIKYTV